MLITWVTTVSSSGSDGNVVIKISHGIVFKMTTKIFTVRGPPADPKALGSSCGPDVAAREQEQDSRSEEQNELRAAYLA